MLRPIVVLLIAGLACPLLHGDEPLSIQKVIEVIDLRELPLYGRSTMVLARKVENLNYSFGNPSEFQEIISFHEKQIKELGGKLLVKPITSDRGSFQYFSLSGFIIQMDVTIISNPNLVNVEIVNHGNVNPRSIPRLKGSKIIPRQGFPDICCFAVTPTESRSTEKIFRETHDLLTQAGWSFQDKRNTLSQYKKESVLLLVKSEYQVRNKYVEISYRPYLSSMDYPPPPDESERFLYHKKSPPPDIVFQTFTTPLTKNEVIDYYRDGFQKRNWKEFTSGEIDPESRYLLFFENEYQCRMVIKVGRDGENQTVDVCYRMPEQDLDNNSPYPVINFFKRQR